jgi:ankyrin repeat protein
LLRQLLTAVPRLKEVLKPLAGANSTPKSWQEDWHLENLKTLFREAVMKLGPDRVTCFIDALDECPEVEIRDMIEFFEELGESTAKEVIGLRVCFSSRHYPQITMMKCQPMILDGQVGHEDDIARFVKSKLKVREGKQAQEVRTAVQAKAKGVFIWVVLVVRILNAESDSGTSNAKLRTCLDRIPAELHDLFQDILQRGIQDNKYLLPILQWISFAQRPLTREELYFAVRSGSTDFIASQPWDPEEDDARAMELFILDSSKGLAEMTKGETPTIQFIHESVRDYLHDTGFAVLAPDLSGNLLGLTHDYLKRCCLNFITESILNHLSLPEPLPEAISVEAESLREHASKLFPFLEYATENLISHAELAIGNGVDQFGPHATTWLSETLWRPFNDLFAIHDSGRLYPGISTASIFVHSGAVHLLRHACDPLHPYELAPVLLLAIQSENIHLVTALLDTMNELVPAIWTQLSDKEGTDLLFRTGRLHDVSFFHALLESGLAIPTAVEDLLLEITKSGSAQAIVYLSAKGVKVLLHGASAMHGAINRGKEDVVQVLIDLGLTPENYLEAYSLHPLVTASQVGRAGIVRVLLKNRTYVSAPNATGMSLLAACGRGHPDVVRLLLDFGALVNYSDLQDGTPLNVALKKRNLPVVELLLKHGALVSLLDLQDGAILMLAACRCRQLTIVQQLLDHGADVNIGDGWQTPLAVACELGEVSIVQALLAGGADPDSEGYWPPLSLLFYRLDIGWSERFPHTKGNAIARLLLNNSADPNVLCASSDYSEALFTREQQRALSRTLMYGASIMGNAELLRLLFEKGADATVRDARDYHDALEVSCRNGREEIVKILLANGTRVALREAEYYRGVVDEATGNRHGRIVRLLLTEGHRFCVQNRNLYSVSLQVAMEKGYDEIAQLLMDMGVELPEQTKLGSATYAALPPLPLVSHYSNHQPVATGS